MFIDSHYRYLESTRNTLSIIVTPIQRLAAMPSELLYQANNFFITQHTQQVLLEENNTLKQQHQSDTAQLLELQALQLENQQLRKLNALPIRSKLSTQLVEIVYAERDIFKRRILVKNGEDTGVKIGQVVMDDTGIVGQVTRVYPWLSEVTLITERDHAVPVQIQRNGLRTIVFGAGDTSQMSLRYMPISADIEEGDVLVTSGIDGLYPAGIPVATVTKVERNEAYPFAKVSGLPIAGVDKHRHLIILSNQTDFPQRPTSQNKKSLASESSKAKHK